jgi:hypothetical protein
VNGSGLLLKTPAAMDAYSEKLNKKKQTFGNSGTLAQEIATGFIYQRGLLPTPQAMDMMTNPPRRITASGRIISNQGHNGSAPLKDLAMNGMLPTPTTHDSKHSTTKSPSWDKRIDQKHLEETVLNPYIQERGGTTSQLNPRFVAEMMGFPPNWTELPFLSGEQNQ